MPRTRHATDPTGQAGVTRSHQRAKVLNHPRVAPRTTKYHARGLGHPTSFAQGKTVKYRALKGVALRLALRVRASRPQYQNIQKPQTHNKRGKPHKKGGRARGLVQQSIEKHTTIHKTTRYLINSMLQSSRNTKYAQWQTCS